MTEQRKPTQEQPLIQFAEVEPQPGFSVFVTGHMPDREGRIIPRFPETSIDGVRQELRSMLSMINERRPIQQMICSATAGADLLAIEWAMDNGIHTDVYLPYDEETFIETAVAYGDSADKWKEIYETAKQTETVIIHIPLLVSDPAKPATSADLAGSSQQYVDLNNHMVNQLKPEDRVVAVWDGKGGDAPGGTEHALKIAKYRMFACITILKAYLENINGRYPFESDPLEESE